LRWAHPFEKQISPTNIRVQNIGVLFAQPKMIFWRIKCPVAARNRARMGILNDVPTAYPLHRFAALGSVLAGRLLISLVSRHHNPRREHLPPRQHLATPPARDLLHPVATLQPVIAEEQVHGTAAAFAALGFGYRPHAITSARSTSEVRSSDVSRSLVPTIP